MRLAVWAFTDRVSASIHSVRRLKTTEQKRKRTFHDLGAAKKLSYFDEEVLMPVIVGNCLR